MRNIWTAAVVVMTAFAGWVWAGFKQMPAWVKTAAAVTTTLFLLLMVAHCVKPANAAECGTMTVAQHEAFMLERYDVRPLAIFEGASALNLASSLGAPAHLLVGLTHIAVYGYPDRNDAVYLAIFNDGCLSEEVNGVSRGLIGVRWLAPTRGA